MTPQEWIINGDTGVSSKTIWSVMMGAVSQPTQCGHMNRYDVPHDPDDFGRCYRLLRLFPEWEVQLHEVGKKLPKWGPMVKAWPKMKAIYERDLSTGRSDELYDLMQTLIEEGMLADGWIRKGSCSWESNKS